MFRNVDDAPETIPTIPTGPRDGVVVSYGLHAKRRNDLALELLAHDLDAPPGAQVRQILALSDWLDRLVTQAAVAEHEDGASWRTSGVAAGIARKSAAGGGPAVESRQATGRRSLNGGGDGRAVVVALALAYARRDANHLRTVLSSTLHVIRFPEQANAARARPPVPTRYVGGPPCSTSRPRSMPSGPPRTAPVPGSAAKGPRPTASSLRASREYAGSCRPAGTTRPPRPPHPHRAVAWITLVFRRFIAGGPVPRDRKVKHPDQARSSKQ